MSLSKSRILRSFIWKFLERCSVQLTTFIVTIVLARLLTPDEFGVIAIIVVFVNLANVIVEGGLTAALVQNKDVTEIDFSTIFITSIILSFVTYLSLYLLAPAIAVFYNDSSLIQIVRILSLLIIPSAINSIQKAYASRFLQFGKMFVSALIAVILSGIIGVLLALHNFGVWSLVWQSLINQILATIIMFYLIKWRPKFIFSYNRFKILFSYGWKIFISNFIIALFEDIRSILIGKLFQPSSLAYFDRGKQFPSLIMGNINTTIQSVLFPTFSSEQDNISKVKSMMKKSTQMSCFVVFPLLFFLFIAAEPLVEFILTDKWIKVVPFIRIFCVALVVMPIQSTNMVTIKSLGYSGITLRLEILKKILEAIILIISFQYNVYIVAVGVVVYNFVCLFINLYPNKKLLKYSIFNQLKDIFPIAWTTFISATIAYSIVYFHLSPFITLTLQLITGGSIYIFTNYLIKSECLSDFLNITKQLK